MLWCSRSHPRNLLPNMLLNHCREKWHEFAYRLTRKYDGIKIYVRMNIVALF